MRASALAPLSMVLVLAACVSAPRQPGTTATPAAPAARAAAAPSPSARDTHEQLHTALWMQTSVEYRMVCESIYRAAGAALVAGLADPSWTAAVEQTGDAAALPPAVILDLDETVLDNSRFEGEQALRRQPYAKALWSEWVALRKAALVPGAKAFLAAARARGVAVFFITNRSAAEEADTVANLLALGVDSSPENVLCLGENGWPSDKTSRRQLVARDHRVALLVGDDLGDFISARRPLEQRASEAEKHSAWWGTRWIVLPNPMYGSWERALLGNESGLTDGQSLQRKLSLVKGFTN